jgi:glycosyltransferase involved in cell wall biosynthesis
VATIQPRQNYQRRIRALAQLDKAVSLVIVGSKGWAYEAVFAEVTRQGLEQRVHFPGFIADADLPALYQMATAFVYPSLYEGFGLPALEAMACGTPVIASNRSALPEVVGTAGLLVDPYDEAALTTAIAQVVADKDLQAHLAQAGLLQAKQFCWDDTARQLVALYHQLLENK